MPHTRQNCVTEWSLESGRGYADPFSDVTVDIAVTGSYGAEQIVPTFWRGDRTWTVRFSAPAVGDYCWRSICSDETNADLHGREGTVTVTEYDGSNGLLRHGPVRPSRDRRSLEHADGTPLLWLGDTWWMGLCRRLGWPGDFQTLAADRVAKGFNVVQIVAGIYPDMDGFEPRSANEAGHPWDDDFTVINPAYFDNVDHRIHHLVSQGLMPCIVACWGYYLPQMGIEKMKQHWRHLIARYGAYPVVWCVAGEAGMPYYLTETREEDMAFQVKGWTELTRYVREADPFGRLVTIHPRSTSREEVDDVSVLDMDMLQTGHGDRDSIPNTYRRATAAQDAEPRMPWINSEVCYEGIGEACRQEVQRFMFWSCMLSGACGHTYGANGIWQVNGRSEPYGPSPHGMSWGDTPWDEAMQLPGSGQLGLGKRLLERFDWPAFEPQPDWVQPHATDERPVAPYAAGIPGRTRVFYLPRGVWGVTFTGLEADTAYRACLFNPVNAAERDLGAARGDDKGEWKIPLPRTPLLQDWVVVLDAE